VRNTKKWLPNTGSLNLDYDTTIQENEYRINRLSGALSLLSLIGVVVAYLLNYFGVFILDNRDSFNIMILMLPFTVFAFLIAVVFPVKRPWVKYALLIDECIQVLILFTGLSMHVVLWFAIPVVKACLYFDRKLYHVSFFCISAAMLLAHILSVRFSIVPTDTLAENMYSAIVYAFIPRYLEFSILSIVALFLCRNSSGLIKRTYAVAEKNRALLEEVRSTHYEIVRNLATIAENKSNDTGEHIGRVFEYMRILADGLGYNSDEAYDIALAAMLHDIGKLGVDERILSKPARLTEEEFREVKKHVVVGKSLLSNSGNEVMKLAAVIAEQHHERWDGTGYLGLKGEQIDKVSRMMSVADVFDALTSRRSYKEPWTAEAAYDEIVRGRGTKFDPVVVDAFVQQFDRFRRVCREMNPTAQN